MSNYPGFGKSSGPTVPPKSQPSFGLNNNASFPRPPSPSNPPPPSRPKSIESFDRNDGEKLFYHDLNAHTPERPTPVTTFNASRDSTAGVTARNSTFPNQQRTRSPPISYADIDDLRNSGQTCHRNKPSSMSPPGLGSVSNVPRTVPHSQILQTSLSPNVSEATVSRLIVSIAPKRTRSPPPSFSVNETLEGNSISSEDKCERV